MKYLLILLFLTGCNNESVDLNNTGTEAIGKQLELSLEYIDQSTYWCLPQYFGENKDIPKYCSYGTYTHKHIPLAFKANNEIYHVYTDNTKDDNFYVYAAKGNTERVLVHTIENWEDPHTNAIIHVLDSGIVHVHVSARGIKERNTYQSGKILTSKTPYELDFECIDCDVNHKSLKEQYPEISDIKKEITRYRRLTAIAK